MLPGIQAKYQRPVLDPTPFVVLTGSLAVGVLTLLVVSGRPGDVASRPVLALVLAAAMATGDRLLLALLGEGDGPGFELDEIFLVAMALLLDPATAAAAFAIGAAGNHLTRPMPLTKRLFNTSQLVVSGSAAFAVMAWLDPTVREGPAHVVAVVMGAGVYFAVNQGLVARVVELVTGSPYWTCLASELVPSALLWGANVSIGLLIGLVALSAPWIAPLAAVPAAMLHVTSRAHERARADREQLRGLLRAAVHTASADTAQAAEVALTGAARDLLGCARARVGSDPPADGELGVAFPGSGTRRWLVVAGRQTFTAGSREVLGALVAIGSGTLDRVAVVDQLRRQAATDALTGLPNEACLFERLEAAVATARATRTTAALVRVDLDDFRKVNESKGRAGGSELLRLVAERLAASTPRGAVLARVGGDSFAVVVPPAVHPAAQPVSADWMASRVLDALARPFVVDDTEVVLTASAGIATYPEHGADAAGLMQAGEVALRRAKAAGGAGSVAFLPWMRTDARTRLTREAELRRAIDGGQLRVEYQPVVSLATGEVEAAEALVRWDHPRLGALGPCEFIPLAERTGMILDLDRVVLRQACRQARAWSDRGHPVRVAVNLSGRHFRDPGLAAMVLAAVDEAGVDPHLIELEVTESVAVDDSGIAVHELGRLRANGLSVAIDDFGTGYSMLARLQDFPVDRVKIDRSFVAAVDGTGRAPLVEAVVAMARSLGLTVVAEGVETPVQRAVLAAMGCEHAQGWLFGRPSAPGAAGPGTPT